MVKMYHPRINIGPQVEDIVAVLLAVGLVRVSRARVNVCWGNTGVRKAPL